MASGSRRKLVKKRHGQDLRRGTPHPWKNDPLRPRIERAVAEILQQGKEVAPVEVLARMSILDRDDLVRWRAGQVQYLERVIRGSLPRLSRLLRILRWHAHDLNLCPRPVAYRRPKRRGGASLRFTKTGDRKLEEAYATHFVWPGKGPFHPPGGGAGDTQPD